MPSDSREQAAFAEVLALGHGTRVLRAIASPLSVLLALLLFWAVVKAREHEPPKVEAPPPIVMTVSLETLPPPPPPPPAPAPSKPDPAPRIAPSHARAPAEQPQDDV